MVDRKIIFYRWMPVNSRPAFVPHAVATALAKKIADDEYAAMLEGKEITTAVHVIAAGSATTPSRFRLLSLRSVDNRPLQWEPGADLAPLPLLDDQYPADVTYVTVWPDYYAAQDSYSDAPRLGRLAHFLIKKENAHVSFDPLYMPDVYERLHDIRGQMRGVQMSLTRPEYMDRTSGILRTFLPAIYGHSAPSVKVEVGMGKYTKRDQYFTPEADEAVFQIAESAHELVDRLIIRGRSRRTNRMETLNMMTERLQETVSLPSSKEASAFPDPDATFKAHDAAYQAFKDRGVLDRATQALLTASR
ncbi:hypothetical protein ABZ647_11090 [Micromonospora aurantiaca]|uniref:hypothetical protein n=1 Tax=Micromonospora aurantiaca (nom. illeg.) TaxID=47850 RepID=UPI0033E85C0F